MTQENAEQRNKESKLSKIIKIWIEDKEKCDINKDKVCNTEDFSILMYHIQK